MTEPTFQIVNPPELGQPRGWNNGMLASAEGRVLFVAGQIGTDEDGQITGATMAEQFGAALANILRVVRTAGGGVATIGRLTIYVTRHGSVPQRARRDRRRVSIGSRHALPGDGLGRRERTGPPRCRGGGRSHGRHPPARKPADP